MGLPRLPVGCAWGTVPAAPLLLEVLIKDGPVLICKLYFPSCGNTPPLRLCRCKLCTPYLGGLPARPVSHASVLSGATLAQ